MRTYILLTLMFLSNILIVEAQLSDYPNFLIKNGILNVTLVVGDKSSSVNVLSQAAIASSLASFSSNAIIQNKLSSEIYDLNQNVISIGNPCVNDISAKIMDGPSPCDKDFEIGKGYIMLYQYDSYYHIIVAGYTDLGTKKAAEILANYDEYNLYGNKYIIEISGEKPVEKQEAETEIENKTQEIEIETKKEEIEIIKIIDELENTSTKENEIVIRDEIKEELITEETKDVEVKTDVKPLEKKKDNFIKRLLAWFLSLFE
ncbi:hypothetical protein HYW99_03905 [Candidatus Woesearchaeota archaeon]|nr:hypothetical protein [Candidatus Woesearchaeota archaeon]